MYIYIYMYIGSQGLDRLIEGYISIYIYIDIYTYISTYMYI
jgi:hypothetical protein